MAKTNAYAENEADKSAYMDPKIYRRVSSITVGGVSEADFEMDSEKLELILNVDEIITPKY